MGLIANISICQLVSTIVARKISFARDFILFQVDIPLVNVPFWLFTTSAQLNNSFGCKIGKSSISDISWSIICHLHDAVLQISREYGWSYTVSLNTILELPIVCLHFNKISHYWQIICFVCATSQLIYSGNILEPGTTNSSSPICRTL